MTIEPFSEIRLFSSLSHFCSLNLISFSEGNWRRPPTSVLRIICPSYPVVTGHIRWLRNAHASLQVKPKTKKCKQWKSIYTALISCWSGNQLIHLIFIYISIFVFACTILCKLACATTGPQGKSCVHCMLVVSSSIFPNESWILSCLQKDHETRLRPVSCSRKCACVSHVPRSIPRRTMSFQDSKRRSSGSIIYAFAGLAAPYYF